MKITLDKRVKVVKVLNKSRGKMLKNCKVHDVLLMEVDASPVGGNSGTYASYITVTNTRTKEVNCYSFNQLSQLYRVLELEEI